MTTVFNVATEADFDAAIVAIDAGGADSAPNTAYVIQVATDLSMTADIPAITLASGDTLTIMGDNPDNTNLSATIDGGGSRGFIVNSGSVIISDLSLVAMHAPGGTGGQPGGGGALYVAAGASVSANQVNFSGDSASGGTPAGGAVFVAQGGTFSATGGAIGGSGSAAGNGVFIAGNSSLTLTNEVVTGGIADQTGAKLGTGALSVVADGAVTLGGTNTYTGGTQVNGTLTLTAAGAAGSGAIRFGASTGDTLVIGAGAPTNTIDGFGVNAGAPSNTIDLSAIGTATHDTFSASTHQVSVIGSKATATLNLDPTYNYGADSFVLQPDAGTGTAVTVVQSSFLVGSEADFNAALAKIDLGGLYADPKLAYSITFTAGFALTTDLNAIDLAAGSSLTINGAGFTLDGANTFRGFFDYAGGLTLENLTIQNTVATGGSGGAGATPGGGGAGLGGALFVASGAAATLSNVTFLNDRAIGGAGGASGTGTGGGGGLGGQGGAGVGSDAGGGGGIGLGAIGGNGGGVSGGAGIVLGVAGGHSGTGNRPTGGSGAADGGGGGGAGTIVTTGSGRGGGGSRTYPGIAGSGGVGGSFGGGAASGGVAGFGGGGAASAGGWGGGGSLNAGGFGGGVGGSGAGGGLGAGGAVFVQQGGSLTILAGSLTGDSVSGGAGSNGGTTGSAFGSGIFIQGTHNLTFAPASGQTLTIANVIADESGSGGTGSGSVLVSGAGTVVLSATNKYIGGTELQGGTLSLQAPGAAGSGRIIFAYGTADTLLVGGGDVPTNIINGFLPGDTIDLQGIGTATSATPGAHNVLTISGGTTTVHLALNPAQVLTGESFAVKTDGHGGTLLTATDVANDMPPSVTVAANVAGNDHTALDPLASVTVADLDTGQTESATLTLSSTLNGTLSNFAGGTYNAATGVYTVSGSTTAVTAALRGLVYTPTIHEVTPGQVVTTGFNLSVTDGLMTSTPTTTRVNITAQNDPPVISGMPPSFIEGYWNVPLNPFPTATITDPDFGATETVTLSVSSGTLSLSMPGVSLTQTGAGTYALSAASPAVVSAALDALQYTTGPNPNVPGYTITYVGMSVSDGIAPPVTSQVEVLAGLPIFTGTDANQTVPEGQSLHPFSTVAVTDSAGLSIQGMTITLYDSSSGFASPTDANGTLSGADLTKVGVGTYTLTPGSTAAVSAELDALTFTATANAAPLTTDFVLSAFDGATTADNYDTTVSATPVAALSASRMAFIQPVAGGGGTTITASGVGQTLTAGGEAETLVGYSGGSDVFRGTAAGLNGDTIGNLLASDKIDITDMGFGAAVLTATASGSNTLVTVTSGAMHSAFTLTGSFPAGGFALASDGHSGTFISHS